MFFQSSTTNMCTGRSLDGDRTDQLRSRSMRLKPRFSRRRRACSRSTQMTVAKRSAPTTRSWLRRRRRWCLRSSKLPVMRDLSAYRLWQRSERPAVCFAAASGKGLQCRQLYNPKSGAPAGQIAESAADERRGWSRLQNRAQLHQAQVNLERTRILSPANGYVTNLLAHLGDFVNVGVNTISVVDADSYWVDGYFEGNEHRADPRGRRGQNHVDGLQRGCARTRRQHRPSHQCFECAARQPGRGYGQPDLHLGAPCPARIPGPDPYR